MTLRRKMGYQIAAMIVGLVLMIGAGLWGVLGMHADFSSAIAGYEELRSVYEISSHVAVARTLLTLPGGDARQAMQQLQTAAGKLKLFAAVGAGGPAGSLRGEIGKELESAQAQLWGVIAAGREGDAREMLPALNRILVQASNLAAEMRGQIERTQEAANRKRRTTVTALAAVSAVAAAGTILVGVWHYRSVMRPLTRFGQGVRRVAEGQFAERVEEQGHAEFEALAKDFNRMAAELHGLYRELERKVAEKSRELVRSERLASVGYLAAGVAHEINNPIGIIAGYAEFAQKKLDGEDAAVAVEEARRTLGVICEEAFRCKQIVQKLLTLARPGEERRAAVSLGRIASEVVSIVGGLQDDARGDLALEVAQGPDLTVLASEGEMKQVVLNLTLNALEAVKENGGRVRVAVTGEAGKVKLVVEDTGRGMSAEVLERIFEPFYTGKRGSAAPGTGLGLSITHAIVENHGGRIVAESDGVGKGSRFVVELPGLGEGVEQAKGDNVTRAGGGM